MIDFRTLDKDPRFTRFLILTDKEKFMAKLRKDDFRISNDYEDWRTEYWDFLSEVYFNTDQILAIKEDHGHVVRWGEDTLPLDFIQIFTPSGRIYDAVSVAFCLEDVELAYDNGEKDD